MTHDMTRVTAPSAPLITLADAKAHLVVSHLLHDTLIQNQCAAVEEFFDGYYGCLGRALQVQSWKLTLDDLPCSGVIRLPLAPFRSVTSIEYDNEAGDTFTIDPSVYKVRRDHGLGVIAPAYNQQWPSAIITEVRITYEVGHAPGDNPLPKPIYQAALLQLGSLYDNRDAEVEGRIITPNPAAERLFAPYVVRSW